MVICLLRLLALGSLFDAFLFILTKDNNTIVGTAACAVSVSQFLSLPCAAIVTDTNNRGIVAKVIN